MYILEQFLCFSGYQLLYPLTPKFKSDVDLAKNIDTVGK